MAKKNISINLRGKTIKEILDFNSENLGLSITFIMPKDFSFESAKLGKSGLIGCGMSQDILEMLKSELGASNYKKYILERIEKLSESLSKYLEIAEKDEIVVKSVISENGVVDSYLNGRKVDSFKWPKDLAEMVLISYRKTFLEKPNDSRIVQW